MEWNGFALRELTVFSVLVVGRLAGFRERSTGWLGQSSRYSYVNTYI